MGQLIPVVTVGGGVLAIAVDCVLVVKQIPR